MAPLSRVLWIAGPEGSGKTTVATRLARRHGLRWYGSDTRTWQHRDGAVREGNAAAARWEALAPGERWVGPDEELLAMSLHRERGRMVVDDVLALPEAPLVVAEGTPVPLGVVDPRLAVCLLPRESLRGARLTERGLSGGPARLYAFVASEVERDARARAVPVIEADGVTRRWRPSRSCSRMRSPRARAPARGWSGVRSCAKRTRRW